MRKKTISPQAIIEATILLVAQDGLENITTRKVAKQTGIAEGSIFNYFPTKKNLLVSSLYHIDREIDVALKNVAFQGLSVLKNVKAMWYAYFNYFISHGDCAKYYRQFRNSSYFDIKVMEGQGKSFSFFADLVFKNVSLLGINPEIFWTYTIETTLSFAVRVVDGQLPGTLEDIDKYFDFIAYGMTGMFKKSSKDKLFF